MNTAVVDAAPSAEATAPGWLAGLRCIFLRDLRIAARRRTDALGALLFFVMVVSLFPLGVGPEPALLRTMAPGVVWVAALLACTLPLARLFADDHQDGTLEQLLIGAIIRGAAIMAGVMVAEADVDRIVMEITGST